MYTEVREYYELQCISQGMYGIRRHAISDALEYRSTDYLIPTSLAYLQRVGTLADFEPDIEYYYADLGDNRFQNVERATVLRDYIHYRFGEYVYTDTRDGLEARIPHSQNHVKDFLPEVHEAVISVQELKGGSP